MHFTLTVRELVEKRILEKPMDGNHGSYHPASDEYVEKGIPFVMASDLVGGKIDYIKCKKITIERANKLQKGFSKLGDVLLTHKATIGRTAIVSNIDENSFVMLTPQVTYYRVKNKNILDNRYLKYYFDSLEFQNILMQWSGGGSTRAYLGITGQLDLPISFPNIEQQLKIVSYIEPIDDKIALNNQMNETLESMAKAIFKEWFIDFGPVRAKAEGRRPFGMDDETVALFPDSFEDSELGPIPKGWKLDNINEFSYLEYGKNLSVSKLQTNGFPVYGAARIIGYYSKSLYKKPTILITCRGNGSGDILETKEEAFVTNNSIAITPKDENLRHYLRHFLKSINTKVVVTGSAQPQITISNLNTLKILIPNKNIFSIFYKLIDPLWKMQSLNDNQNEDLNKLRDLLLPKLISGEISLSNNEISPTSNETTTHIPVQQKIYAYAKNEEKLNV
ncbi:restriction endonuclease subunit S [Spirobacillus cienkowskii]|uniref:restriction endonuclease subunit S n=1 Tax=Spirobacillus cienkowskii TaxID=495820 RepID=UPI0030D2FC45